MIKKIIGTSLLLGLSTAYLHAQTLFKYGNNEVSKDEFLKVYSKNNAGKDQFKKENVENYLDLYALFKMKVAEAKQLQMDTAIAMKMEIENYKVQLSKNYLIDQNISNKLVDEAYNRLQHEVEIAHILIASRGQDTTQAYSRIQDIYAELEKGKSFEAAAKEYSNDVASAPFGGRIGYISALDVFYPIENAAYATPKGSFSRPFRSPLGYHIVKVLDKRPTRGQVQVAQILLSPKQGKLDEAHATMKEIQAALRKGEDFSKLVSQYSEDIHTKNSQGVLEPFSTGTYEEQFENVAFSLKKIGDISEPFEGTYGLHILKLIHKDDYKDVSKTKEVLKQRILQDDRLKIAEEAYAADQISKLGIQENADALEALANAIDADTAAVAQVSLEKYVNYNQPLLKIGATQFTQKDLIQHIETSTGGRIFGKKKQSVLDIYQIFKNKQIQQAQIADLENNNADFRFAMQEYQDAVLLYAIMENKVWSKGMTDQEGIQAYYNQNKNKYTYEQGFEGYMFQSLDNKILEKLQERINKGEEPTEAKEDLNINDPSGQQILTEKATFEYKSLPSPIAALPDGSMSAVTAYPNKGFYFVVPIRNFPAGTPKPLEACRGLVITDYQKSLENQWHQELKSKYPVKVEQKTLKSILNK